MPSIEVENHNDHIIVVRLANPKQRNSLSEAMSREFLVAMEDIGSVPDLRCVILTGTPPAFSSGGDVEMIENVANQARQGSGDSDMTSFYNRFVSLRGLPVPTIAAVNGDAFGAGFALAMLCDMAVVAKDAQISLNFSRLGLHPGMGTTWLLPRLTNSQRSAYMLHTGIVISGEEAVEIGLAIEAADSEVVVQRAIEIADLIVGTPADVSRQLTRVLRDGTHRDLSEQVRIEAKEQRLNFASDDLIEGLAAFREKRPPQFARM